MKTLVEQLDAVGACSDAKNWIEESGFTDLADAWECCNNGGWLLWLVGAVMPKRLTPEIIVDVIKQSVVKFPQLCRRPNFNYEPYYVRILNAKRPKYLSDPHGPFGFAINAAMGYANEARASGYYTVEDRLCAGLRECSGNEDDIENLSKLIADIVRREIDIDELTTDLDLAAEESEPSKPDDFSESITIEQEKVSVNRGFRGWQDEDGFAAYMNGKEIASATSGDLLNKKLRKMRDALCSPRIFGINDHGNVTEYDYFGREINSWV